VMIDKGIVEFGGKRTELAVEDILKLKSILDELGIMHIIDDVTFSSPTEEVERMKVTPDLRMWMVENDSSVSPKDEFDHRKRLEFRELIIPYLFEIDFMSLTQLDYEEAELLADLLYGTEY